MKSKFRLLIFFGMLLVLIGTDKASKEIAKEHLKGKGSISYFHDTFRLQYVENVGAFLSMGSNLPKKASFWVFGVVPSLFLLGFMIYLILKRNSLEFKIYLAYILILAGGMGNILDRLINDRHVTDFLNVGIQNLRTGIFNLADLYVTTGIVCLFIFMQIEAKKQKLQNS